MIYRVNDVEEAVALAEQFKSNGTHNWFRGQTDDWPLKSSRARLTEEERQASDAKMRRFLEWVGSTPGLEALAQNTDLCEAVAQHYGIPTNFIDFTTEPRIAGFFATHGTPPPNGECCILCWNTEEVMEIWNMVAPIIPELQRDPIEFLTLDVPNLWRLEAQHGVFFYCPYAKFERTVSRADRIVFPYTGPVESPSEELIYPKRKSQLEILLDQYFWTENNREINKMLEELFPPEAFLKEPEIALGS